MARDTLRDFYVYVIFRPNGVPCYVGKGRRNRWEVHSLKTTRNTNRHLSAIYKEAGGKLPIVKVRERLTDKEAIETEVALIRGIGRHRHGGPLVNFTDGGEGHAGYEQSTETKAWRSEHMRGNKRAIGHRRTDFHHSPETIARISEAKKGHPGPNPGVPRTMEVRLKVSLTKRRASRQGWLEGI